MSENYTIEGRSDTEIALTESEHALLVAVKQLFDSKGKYDGGDFRVAFVADQRVIQVQ